MLKKITVFLLILAAMIVGYYAFVAGVILLKIFIGLLIVSIFALGVYVGRLTKKSNNTN